MFTNGPKDRGTIHDRVIPTTQRMVFDTSLHNTQHYKVHIKGKVVQFRKREPSCRPWLRSLTQYIYIYIYIYIIYIYIYIYIYNYNVLNAKITKTRIFFSHLYNKNISFLKPNHQLLCYWANNSNLQFVGLRILSNIILLILSTLFLMGLSRLHSALCP